jgi:4-hydroxy-tetrahydrodipicolinate synthase
MFEGTGVALVTPFREGRLDGEAFRTLAQRCVEDGCENLVVTGCTGEAATLTGDERETIIRIALEEARGKAKVIAGTGTNNTTTTLELSRQAEALRVDGVMLITPYYNKPTQAGLREHYRVISEALRIPIILYNVPGRTGVSLSPSTIAAIAEHKNVVALKEAGGSVDRVSEIRAESSITILSGDDSLTLPMLSVGAEGVISVVANIVPGRMRAMLDAWRNGETGTALAVHEALLPLMDALFVETNPAPVKYALSLCGIIRNELRLPLVPVTPASEKVIAETLSSLSVAGCGRGDRV